MKMCSDFPPTLSIYESVCLVLEYWDDARQSKAMLHIYKHYDPIVCTRLYRRVTSKYPNT